VSGIGFWTADASSAVLTCDAGSDVATADGWLATQAVVTPEQPSGGWGFLNSYHAELQRRKALAKKRRELEEETEQIQDALDRNIAQLMREQEAIDEKKKDLERLGEIARAQADLEAAKAYSERVAIAYARAITKGTYSALEALDRELQRAQEENEFLAEAVRILIDD
jgi:mevalonate kinase